MKKWYTSKTLWVNIVAIVAIVGQGISGREILPVDAQAAILGVINLVLRLVTKESIIW